jgi:flagellar biosynthesis protein FlhF
MNVKRFTGRTSKDALALVRQAFGDDAVVMSTRPCAEGVEVLAMAPESIQQLERVGLPAEPVASAPVKAQRNVVQPRAAQAPLPRTPLQPTVQLPATPQRGGQRLEPVFDNVLPPAEPSPVAQDVEQLQMSTLSFQDYVRQRMLKRREAQLAAEASVEPEEAPLPPVVSPIAAARARLAATQVPVLREELAEPAREPARPARQPAAPRAADPVLAQALPAAPAGPGPDQIAMMGELRSMRGLIEQRFGALAFMEKLQRQPRQAQLAQKLLDTGFSPALIKKLVQALPADTDPIHWAGGVLERNLATAEREVALEDAGGIYAVIGATGVGKTTSTAKLAAAFAARHGAAELGLITLDAYRIGAQEQLRTYGRILGVPVHTAHDRASLDDLLELLSGKRMVLIDTAGMAQRDARTRELLDMLSHRSINRLLVLNASAQGETIEDQIAAYAGTTCRGVVLSKLDEAVKLAPALDSCIRHKLKVLAVANGQRVPEDWHRLSANALVQRALKGGGSQAWKMDDEDVNLVFAGMPAMRQATAAARV